MHKPPLIFRRGYVPAQCRRNLTRRDGTTEGGEHVVADAALQRPAARFDDAETGRSFLGKQADHGKDSIVAHALAPSSPTVTRSSSRRRPDLRPERPRSRRQAALVRMQQRLWVAELILTQQDIQQRRLKPCYSFRSQTALVARSALPGCLDAHVGPISTRVNKPENDDASLPDRSNPVARHPLWRQRAVRHEFANRVAPQATPSLPP